MSWIQTLLIHHICKDVVVVEWTNLSSVANRSERNSDEIRLSSTCFIRSTFAVVQEICMLIPRNMRWNGMSSGVRHCEWEWVVWIERKVDGFCLTVRHMQLLLVDGFVCFFSFTFQSVVRFARYRVWFHAFKWCFVLARFCYDHIGKFWGRNECSW